MDFFQNRETGQLWLEDRKWLFETVRDLRPRVAVETGTWLGGGSTFFIASALYYNSAGLLYTVESNPDFHRQAIELYDQRWPFLKPFVDFSFGDSVSIFAQQPQEIDFLFLDSCDDPQKCLAEFQLLAPRLRFGGVLMAHDWFNGKAEAIKPLLTNNPQWHLETIGTGDGTFEKGSVGMAKAIKLTEPSMPGSAAEPKA